MTPYNKYNYFLRIALGNLGRSRLRTASIAVPLVTIISIVSAVTFFLEGVEKDAMLAARSFPDILLQQQVGGRTESLLLDRYMDLLDKTEGIRSYEPRVWGHISTVPVKGRSKAFVGMGLRPEFLASGEYLLPAIRQGRSLHPGDKDVVLLGEALGTALNCRVGDTVEITSPDLKEAISLEVIGIFTADVQIYTADLALMPIDAARRLFNYYEAFECSDVMVYLDDPGQAGTIARLISTSMEGARPLLRTTIINLVEQSFGQRSGYFHLLWLILLINIMIIAWFSTTSLSLDQGRQIGILMALGWDNLDIMSVKGVEMLIIGLFSSLFGLIAGIVYMLVDAPGMKRFIIGWAEIYPDFPIPLYINWQSCLIIIVLGVFPLLTATLIPIWRISQIDPVKVMQQ